MITRKIVLASVAVAAFASLTAFPASAQRFERTHQQARVAYFAEPAQAAPIQSIPIFVGVGF